MFFILFFSVIRRHIEAICIGVGSTPIATHCNQMFCINYIERRSSFMHIWRQTNKNQPTNACVYNCSFDAFVLLLLVHTRIFVAPSCTCVAFSIDKLTEMFYALKLMSGDANK